MELEVQKMNAETIRQVIADLAKGAGSSTLANQQRSLNGLQGVHLLQVQIPRWSSMVNAFIVERKDIVKVIAIVRREKILKLVI